MILEEFHSSPWGGHSCIVQTYKKVAVIFFWKGMRKDVENFAQRCVTWKQSKYQALKPGGLLQPLPIPLQVWEDVSMDFIIGLSKSKGKDTTIMVVVDGLMKSVYFLPLSHPFTTIDVAEAFVKEIIRLHVFPKSIIADMDRVFMRNFWKEIFRLVDSKLKFSSTYHPQTDDQKKEVINKTLETYLRCFVHGHPK